MTWDLGGYITWNGHYAKIVGVRRSEGEPVKYMLWLGRHPHDFTAWVEL